MIDDEKMINVYLDIKNVLIKNELTTVEGLNALHTSFIALSALNKMPLRIMKKSLDNVYEKYIKIVKEFNLDDWSRKNT